MSEKRPPRIEAGVTINRKVPQTFDRGNFDIVELPMVCMGQDITEDFEQQMEKQRWKLAYLSPRIRVYVHEQEQRVCTVFMMGRV